MLRLDAVRAILLDQVAAVRSQAGDDPPTTLVKARRRALAVALVDWAAILALFQLRDAEVPFLVLGPSQQGLFTIGVLAVATHAGFRLGQLEKYTAVSRALSLLPSVGDRPTPPEDD